ncbi:hypothetical protein BGZ65_012151, partial [Modicella reniformis]
ILVGEVLPNGEDQKGFPVTSDYDRCKKENRKKGKRNPWTEIFQSSGMNKADVKKEAEEASAAVKILENDVKVIRKTVLESQKKQTAATASTIPGATDSRSPTSPTSTTSVSGNCSFSGWMVYRISVPSRSKQTRGYSLPFRCKVESEVMSEEVDEK